MDVDIERLKVDREYWEGVQAGLFHFTLTKTERCFGIPRPELQQAQWDGEGLPSVGCECEARYDTYKAEWYRAYIIGFDGNSIIGRWREGPKEGEILDYTVNNAFRPIRFKEQREREDLEKTIVESPLDMDSYATMVDPTSVASAIIAAGWRKANED